MNALADKGHEQEVPCTNDVLHHGHIITLRAYAQQGYAFGRVGLCICV